MREVGGNVGDHPLTQVVQDGELRRSFRKVVKVGLSSYAVSLGFRRGAL